MQPASERRSPEEILKWALRVGILSFGIYYLSFLPELIERLAPTVTSLFFLKSSLLLMSMVAYSLHQGWRPDFESARLAMKRSPLIVLLPITAKSVSILASSGVIHLLSINHTFVVFDSLIYSPIFEEIFFRFGLYMLLMKHAGILASSLIISFVFAYGHDYPFVGTFGSFCSGLAYQYIYIKHRSILICIASHSMINAAALLGMYLHGTD